MFGGQLAQATLQVGLPLLEGVEGGLKGVSVQRYTSHGSTYEVRHTGAYRFIAFLYAMPP